MWLFPAPEGEIISTFHGGLPHKHPWGDHSDQSSQCKRHVDTIETRGKLSPDRLIFVLLNAWAIKSLHGQNETETSFIRNNISGYMLSGSARWTFVNSWPQCIRSVSFVLSTNMYSQWLGVLRILCTTFYTAWSLLHLLGNFRAAIFVYDPDSFQNCLQNDLLRARWSGKQFTWTHLGKPYNKPGR